MTVRKLRQTVTVIRRTRTSNARLRGIAAGYRSGLEETIAVSLQRRGFDPHFEETKIEYRVEETRRYTPDFPLDNGVIVESKGRFTAADRKKHLLVKEQHPHLDIRFVFSRSSTRISKTSQTTYADWCRKNGFLFADKDVPDAWLLETK